MKSLFICLANSKKFGERCIAGIEVKKTGGSYQPVVKEGRPRWLRPISKLQHGAVGEHLVGGINLMDIIEIDVEELCPNGYQSENATFKPESIKKIGNIRLSEENLDRIIDLDQNYLFGNKGKAVSEDVIDEIDRSLTLIKVTDFQISKRGPDGQLRIDFEFNYNRYDLPITDIAFIQKYSENEALLDNTTCLYLALSLGIYHNGWHSKTSCWCDLFLMMEKYNNSIHTVGYAAHTVESFIAALKEFNITAIADVRSQPYSRFKPEFNKENLKYVLMKSGIEYVFLGDNIGARIKAPECYKNGQVDYELISKHPLFKEGIDRLLMGMKRFSIALMCAEKDPINCHRTILICKNLKKYRIKINHIVDAHTCENHTETELRLLKLFKLEQPDLFMNKEQRLEEAYSRQEEKIAFVAENEATYIPNSTGIDNEKH